MRTIDFSKCVFQDREDGVYFCEGSHSRNVNCIFVKLTSDDLGMMWKWVSEKIEEDHEV